MAIKSVKVWNNQRYEIKDCRVYVHTEDGREGCKYLTGNKWHQAGEIEGDLTTEDWNEVRALGLRDNKWHSWYPREEQTVQKTVNTPRKTNYSGNPAYCSERNPCGSCFDCIAE